jgi:hypothetical protein
MFKGEGRHFEEPTATHGDRWMWPVKREAAAGKPERAAEDPLEEEASTKSSAQLKKLSQEEIPRRDGGSTIRRSFLRKRGRMMRSTSPRPRSWSRAERISAARVKRKHPLRGNLRQWRNRMVPQNQP